MFFHFLVTFGRSILQKSGSGSTSVYLIPLKVMPSCFILVYFSPHGRLLQNLRLKEFNSKSSICSHRNIYIFFLALSALCSQSQVVLKVYPSVSIVSTKVSRFIRFLFQLPKLNLKLDKNIACLILIDTYFDTSRCYRSYASCFLLHIHVFLGFYISVLLFLLSTRDTSFVSMKYDRL